MANALKDLADTKLGDKLGLKESEVYKNLMKTSPYELEAIIGHQRKIERIISGKLAN